MRLRSCRRKTLLGKNSREEQWQRLCTPVDQVLCSSQEPCTCGQ